MTSIGLGVLEAARRNSMRRRVHAVEADLDDLAADKGSSADAPLLAGAARMPVARSLDVCISVEHQAGS